MRETDRHGERAHLSDEVSVESEADVCGVGPVDDGDAGPVSGDVQPLDDPLDKVEHVVPPLGVHGARRVKHEHHIHLPAAFYNAPPVTDDRKTTYQLRTDYTSRPILKDECHIRYSNGHNNCNDNC